LVSVWTPPLQNPLSHPRFGIEAARNRTNGMQWTTKTFPTSARFSMSPQVSGKLSGYGREEVVLSSDRAVKD